jgi:uncharacterized membrane protein YfcA
LILAALAVMLGAFIQTGVGFGVGLVAAPLLMFTLPATVPGTLLIVGGLMAMITLLAEWRSVDWPKLGWTLLGRLPGVVAGTWLLVVASKQWLGVIIGVIVLIAAGLQWWRWNVALNTRNLLIAGVISGASGTISSIAGPPLAMVLAGEPGPKVRSTMAVNFVLGTVMSLVGLASTGNVTTYHWVHAALLLPPLVIGAALGRPLARYLDSGRTRAAILIMAGISGLALVISSLLG